MSCVDTPVKFRLLDGLVGWDPYCPGDGRTGTDLEEVTVRYDTYGLRLDHLGEPGISNRLVSPYLPPPTLAPGTGAGDWYLCGSKLVFEQSTAFLLRRDPARKRWNSILPRLDTGESLAMPQAVAVAKNRLAVVDGCEGQGHRLLIWSMPEGRLAGVCELPARFTPDAVVFTTWNDLLVAGIRHAADGEPVEPEDQLLLRFDWSGKPRGTIELAFGDLRAKKNIRRLRTAPDGSIWAAEGGPLGPFHLWRIGPRTSVHHACPAPMAFDTERLTDVDFYHQAQQRLDSALARTSLMAVGAAHFCIREVTASGDFERLCFDGGGEQLAAEPAELLRGEAPQAIFETVALDSFIPRCQWHRVRIDAELPKNTGYEIQVATSEVELVTDTGEGSQSKSFRPVDESPFGSDWQEPAENARDLLIDQPPGRYLYVRIKLTGTATSTPVIRRVRIDFPRVTSLDQLPAVYREESEAEDFTERFLALFDSATEDLDRAIETFPALFDPYGLPDEVLEWLGALLGIAFDPNWNAALRRRLVHAAPGLYRKRGTLRGLCEAIELMFGLDPGQVMIDEHATRRAWGTLANTSHLGGFRLFGKSESRFRIGRSALGVARLRSFGDPEHDPVRQDAHHFTVLVPPGRHLSESLVAHLERLIEQQKPAHTVHHLRIGGSGFVVGCRSAVGIDTQFVAPPPAVLQQTQGAAYGTTGDADGLGAVVLRAGPLRPTSVTRLGVTSAIGLGTQLE